MNEHSGSTIAQSVDEVLLLLRSHGHLGKTNERALSDYKAQIVSVLETVSDGIRAQIQEIDRLQRNARLTALASAILVGVAVVLFLAGRTGEGVVAGVLSTFSTLMTAVILRPLRGAQGGLRQLVREFRALLVTATLLETAGESKTLAEELLRRSV